MDPVIAIMSKRRGRSLFEEVLNDGATLLACGTRDQDGCLANWEYPDAQRLKRQRGIVSSQVEVKVLRGGVEEAGKQREAGQLYEVIDRMVLLDP